MDDPTLGLVDLCDMLNNPMSWYVVWSTQS